MHFVNQYTSFMWRYMKVDYFYLYYKINYYNVPLGTYSNT
jgi:hypothetical protein